MLSFSPYKPFSHYYRHQHIDVSKISSIQDLKLSTIQNKIIDFDTHATMLFAQNKTIYFDYFDLSSSRPHLVQERKYNAIQGPPFFSPPSPLLRYKHTPSLSPLLNHIAQWIGEGWSGYIRYGKQRGVPHLFLLKSVKIVGPLMTTLNRIKTFEVIYLPLFISKPL